MANERPVVCSSRDLGLFEEQGQLSRLRNEVALRVPKQSIFDHAPVSHVVSLELRLNPTRSRATPHIDGELNRGYPAYQAKQAKDGGR